MGALAVYAAMLEPNVAELQLFELPTSHRHGPYLLNVRRVFDMPQALAVAATKVSTTVSSDEAKHWQYTLEALKIAGKSIEFTP